MNVTSGLNSIEGEDVWGSDPDLDGRGLNFEGSLSEKSKVKYSRVQDRLEAL